MNVYIWTSGELKNAYIGEVIVCDFTKSDYWFVFYWRTSSDITYGRDSNWLYCTRSSALAGVSWRIPSSIYSKWTLLRAEIDCYSTATNNWAWLAYWTDTYYVRAFNTVIDKNLPSYSQISCTIPAGWYKLIIDLENGKASIGNTELSLTSSEISKLQRYWTNWTLNLSIFMTSANTTSYVRKVNFYLN